MPLSTQEYERGLGNFQRSLVKCWGVIMTLRCTNILSKGELEPHCDLCRTLCDCVTCT